MWCGGRQKDIDVTRSSTLHYTCGHADLDLGTCTSLVGSGLGLFG